MEAVFKPPPATSAQTGLNRLQKLLRSARTMDFLSAITQNLGLVTFTVIGIALAIYLAYYMIRPQHF